MRYFGYVLGYFRYIKDTIYGIFRGGKCKGKIFRLIFGKLCQQIIAHRRELDALGLAPGGDKGPVEVDPVGKLGVTDEGLDAVIGDGELKVIIGDEGEGQVGVIGKGGGGGEGHQVGEAELIVIFVKLGDIEADEVVGVSEGTGEERGAEEAEGGGGDEGPVLKAVVDAEGAQAEDGREASGGKVGGDGDAAGVLAAGNGVKDRGDQEAVGVNETLPGGGGRRGAGQEDKEKGYHKKEGEGYIYKCVAAGFFEEALAAVGAVGGAPLRPCGASSPQGGEPGVGGSQTPLSRCATAPLREGSLGGGEFKSADGGRNLWGVGGIN